MKKKPTKMMTDEAIERVQAEAFAHTFKRGKIVPQRKHRGRKGGDGQEHVPQDGAAVLAECLGN